MQREAEIKFTIKLNEQNFPTEINWEATDSGFEGSKPAETLFISLWDSKDKNTLSIDLWTDKMLINDMNLHYYQTFMKMADTYQSAAQCEDIAANIKKFDSLLVR